MIRTIHDRIVHYVPYRETNSETREAFHDRATGHGMLAEGSPRRWICRRCGFPLSVEEIGIGYGIPSDLGLPIYRTRGCPAISWDDFREEPDGAHPPGAPALNELVFRRDGSVVHCTIGETILTEHERSLVALEQRPQPRMNEDQAV